QGLSISQDPIGLMGGINVYQYAPNPVEWVDPWGWRRSTAGKQQRLRALLNDVKAPKHIRGWIQQELNRIKGTKKRIRVPPGYDLAHWRGYENAKGFDYTYTDLNFKRNHKIQHRFDKGGGLQPREGSGKAGGKSRDEIIKSRQEGGGNVRCN
ncbi:type IV secretion protein Rhs, partial [Pelistega indica]